MRLDVSFIETNTILQIALRESVSGIERIGRDVGKVACRSDG